MAHSLEGKIKDVYQENMVDELRKISELVEKYNYIAMVNKILSSSKLQISLLSFTKKIF